MLMLRKIVFFFFLFVGLSLFAQQDYMVSSYVRGNFYNRGRISTESLRASDDLIFLNVHPNKDGTLSFENPRAFQGKGVTTWEGLIKSVRAKVKGTKVKIRLGASSGEWKAMVADEAARTTFAKNIKTVLEKNKLDGIDLDFEWAENEKEYKDYSLAILKMREVLGDKYLFSVSLHPVCYKISKEAIEAVDFISLQCYGPSPVRFPIEKYCSDIQMVLEYGIPKEKLVAGVPFYGVTKDNSKKTEAYFNFVQNGLVTSPAQNEVIYQGDTYVFDGQDNIRIKTRYAKEQKLKHRRLRDQRAARLPILGDGIHRHLVLFREIVLPVDIRLEIAGPLGSQRFVELQRTVGRRIARDRHGADLPERILHEVVHKGVESVQLLRIAVERGVERRQIDLVANRIVGVAAAFDDEPANDVVSVGSLRQQYGIGRRSRNRTLGLGRRSGSGTQRERKSES